MDYLVVFYTHYSSDNLQCFLSSRDSECGLIVACIENEKIALPFFPVESDLRTMAKFGDQVP